MTLIVSEVSKYGIAMAADSAITEEYPSTWILDSGISTPPTVRTGVQKLIPIKAINAAVAVWGFGALGTRGNLDARIPMDSFLSDFVDSINKGTSVEEVGNILAATVNERIKIGRVRGGFHIAGFEETGGKRFPVVYHIHTGHNINGPHEALRLYRDFPYGHVSSVEEWVKKLETITYWLRNGAFDTYAYFSDHLNKLMGQLYVDKGFVCPDPSRFNTALEARGRFLRLQVQTICEFYRLSNRLEIIAMPVSWLTISPEGIEHFEPVVI